MKISNGEEANLVAATMHNGNIVKAAIKVPISAKQTTLRLDAIFHLGCAAGSGIVCLSSSINGNELQARICRSEIDLSCIQLDFNYVGLGPSSDVP